MRSAHLYRQGRGSLTKDMAPSSRDRGSVTVIMAAIAAVALMLVLVVVGLAQGMGARAAAQGAADLSALAAATAVLSDGTPPCDLAANVAQRNGAELSSCSVEGAIAEVRVSIRAGPFGAASGTARAGPADG